MSEAQKYKEDGNQYFKDGKYDDALTCYAKALDLTEKDSNERAVYYKNRAACNLKIENYEAAVKDASAALDISPNDPKALFRRCQAFEHLNNPEEAYKDAMKLLSVEPKNTAVQPVLRRLNAIIQEKVKDHMTTNNKISRMFSLVFDKDTEDKEKRLQAANNLIVLAREESGAELIFKNDGVKKLIGLAEEKDRDLMLTAIRVMACLASQARQRSTVVLNEVSLFRICYLVGLDDEEISTAAIHLLHTIMIAITDVDTYKKDRDKHEVLRKKDPGLKLRCFPPLQLDDEAQEIVDKIFVTVIPMLNQAKVSAVGRDNVMEFLLKTVTRTDGVSWTKKMLDTTDGISRILEVAGTMKEHKTISISDSTRGHASLLLSRIYDDTVSDKERDLFADQCNNHLVDMFGDEMMESKVEAIMSVSALLQGPYEVGNNILNKEGVLGVILTMAQSDIALQQKVAVEALVHSASKKEKCSGIIKQAVPILKTLYQSQNDYIKVRALVGLCKLGSFGGTDASAKSFADGSNETLAKACRKFLSNQAKDVDMRRWAAEGLAYLTLDADVKEEVVNDEIALKSLTDLAQYPDRSILYPVATVFVNLTNSYDKPEIEPELIELAKFSKQHVPEDHEKDKADYVKERIKKLVKAGVISALSAFSKTESKSSKELLSRVFLAICQEQEHRGAVIAQGGAKALIPLANDATPVGKAIAAQALAKIAITANPEIAFPGQRACETVRPLLQLLDIGKTALQNFEALMALTNLTSLNDTLRKRVLKEKGFASIEHYMFEEHEMLRRAATECICNLVLCEDAVQLFKGANDRIKLLVLYCGEEDECLVRAASGSLAILSDDEVICHKIVTDTKSWYEILQVLVVNEKPDIQHRGMHILMNLMSAEKGIAKRIIDSELFEIVLAISKLDDPQRIKSKKCAEEALAKAVEWELIQPNAQS